MYLTKHFLEATKLHGSLQFFRQTSGSWTAGCVIGPGKHAHYIAYGAWRGVVYEPFDNQLVALDRGGPTGAGAGGRLSAPLKELDIHHFTVHAQLWKRSVVQPAAKRAKLALI